MVTLKYLKIFEEFNKSKKEKMLDKIKSFFKCDYVAKKAVELHPKLSIWIVKTFKDLLIKEYPSIKDELETYFKTGQNENKYIKLVIKKWDDLSSKYQSIIDWIKSYDVSEEDRKNFSKMTFDEALNKAKEWHNSLKSGKAIENEQGEILMTFPDGFYWIDLKKRYDKCEAEAMGHCGRTNKGDTLISLRDRYKQPHVTAAVDTSEGIIYQMKGKQNTKPTKKYHKYIVALLMNDNLPFKIKGFGSEYKYEDDFSPYDLDKKLFNELISKRPNITKKVFSDEEIYDLYNDFLYSFFTDEYSFALVEKAYELGGIRTVINSINNHNDILFNILKKEFHELFEKDIIDEEKLKIIHNVCSFHCNANHAAEYFKIKLPNPKDSNSGKWHYIIKQVPIEKLEEYIKKEGLEEYYNEELPSSKFEKEIKILNHRYSNKVSYYYDYESILDYIFDYDLDEAFKYFQKIFSVDGKYNKYVTDVWDIKFLISYINENMTRKEKEKELIDYSYIDDYF